MIKNAEKHKTQQGLSKVIDVHAVERNTTARSKTFNASEDNVPSSNSNDSHSSESMQNNRSKRVRNLSGPTKRAKLSKTITNNARVNELDYAGQYDAKCGNSAFRRG